MKTKLTALFRSSAALFLIAVLLLTVFTGCTEKPAAPEESSQPTPEVPPVAEGPEPVIDAGDQEGLAQFYGATFTMVMGSAYVENFYDPDKGSYEADYKLSKIRETEKALDCKLSFAGLDVNTAMLADSVAGSGEYDYFYGPVSTCIGYAKAGLMADWDSMENIDTTDIPKWGTRDFNGAMIYDGKLYGVCCVLSRYWNPYPIFFGGCMYNGELVKANGMPDPMELYEKGKWTFDGFLEATPSYTVADPENPVYCATSYDANILIRSALLANGCNIVNFSEDGRASFGYNCSEAQVAFDWLSKLGSDSSLFKLDSNWLCPTFVKGNAAFYIGMNSWRGVTIQQEGEIMTTMKEVYWMPMPAGPSGNGTHSYVSNTTGGNSIINTPDLDETTYVYNYLAEDPYDGNVFADFFRNSYFFSDASYDFYMNCINSSVYDYTNELSDSLTTIFSKLKLVLMGKKSYSEVIDSVTEKANSELEQLSAKEAS